MRQSGKLGWAVLAAGAALGLAALNLTPFAATPLAAKPVAAKPMNQRGLSELDKNFLKAVNGGNLAEVVYHPMVQKHASAKTVKQFALRMLQDHSKANRELVRLAASKGVSLPHEVADDEKAVQDRLSQEWGSNFDRAYRHEMIRDHTRDICEFEREISLGRDASVKAYASKYLPVLKEHLQLAQNMLPARQ